MRVFVFSTWMILTLRHIRFSFSILLQSNTSKTSNHNTLRKQVFGFRKFPSAFQNNNHRRQISYTYPHHLKLTTAKMTSVLHHSEIETVGSNKNQSIPVVKPSAKIVPSTELDQCGERLRKGGLVSFPTETVYGLGCNALDSSAIIKVFEAKERPLTDPLITHVTENQVAFDLWAADTSDTTSLEGKALHALCDRFWPGPLTLVAEAAPHVPSILMAGTGFCACRSPQHPISIALIDAAKVPIAAPSANKFGHVSPTRSRHVWDDLQHEDVWIVEEENQESIAETSCCQVGVESSVAKIEMTTENERGRITLLRQGAVSLRDIEECLDQAGLAGNFEVMAMTKKATDETVANVAPGQTIRHYSPDIPSFILSRSLCESAVSPPTSDADEAILSKAVLIDFGGRLRAWRDLSIAYQDLSVTADSAEATKGVFDTLRWAEQIQDADQILFPEISDRVEDTGASPDALTLALKDRLTRAASGVVIDSLGAGVP
mmetsp:Transcript_10332/g.30228  ORF Transcript_10332/g.30228 Transcript_10332/m.30228 type:complete len:490 (-) Transcript_10332:166-1635(-)